MFRREASPHSQVCGPKAKQKDEAHDPERPWESILSVSQVREGRKKAGRTLLGV
jgi:hypothetical protein